MAGQQPSFRILVIRLSAMGDVAMTVPVVAALRSQYPEAEIVILTRGFFEPFFRGIDNLTFFSPDLAGRHKGLCGLLRLSRDLGRFDYVADLHDVMRSQVLRTLFFLKGSKIARIDKGRTLKKALTRMTHKRFIQLKPTVERYRDVFLRLRLFFPELVPPAKIHYPLDKDVLRITGEKQGKWIGIAPFAKHTGKIYPYEKMGNVIRKLAEKPGVRLFIFGGGTEEKQIAETMAKGLENVVPVIGKINLTQELDLISNLDVMVSMDSSAMHMASLFGVPVVSIWGATHRYAGFYGFGQDPENAVQVDLPCCPCSVYGNKPCVIGGYPCLHGLPVQLVLERILQQLAMQA